MIFEFECLNEDCGNKFEENISFSKYYVKYVKCPKCGRHAIKKFHATTNMFVPSYFHTSRSDIFSDSEWQELKKDPNVERYK